MLTPAGCVLIPQGFVLIPIGFGQSLWLYQIRDRVRGDPSHGPNGSLYDAMGFDRKSERKSGLTKKKKTP